MKRRLDYRPGGVELNESNSVFGLLHSWFLPAAPVNTGSARIRHGRRQTKSCADVGVDPVGSPPRTTLTTATSTTTLPSIPQAPTTSTTTSTTSSSSHTVRISTSNSTAGLPPSTLPDAPAEPVLLSPALQPGGTQSWFGSEELQTQQASLGPALGFTARPSWALWPQQPLFQAPTPIAAAAGGRQSLDLLSSSALVVDQTAARPGLLCCVPHQRDGAVAPPGENRATSGDEDTLLLGMPVEQQQHQHHEHQQHHQHHQHHQHQHHQHQHHQHHQHHHEQQQQSTKSQVDLVVPAARSSSHLGASTSTGQTRPPLPNTPVVPTFPHHLPTSTSHACTSSQQMQCSHTGGLLTHEQVVKELCDELHKCRQTEQELVQRCESLAAERGQLQASCSALQQQIQELEQAHRQALQQSECTVSRLQSACTALQGREQELEQAHAVLRSRLEDLKQQEQQHHQQEQQHHQRDQHHHQHQQEQKQQQQDQQQDQQQHHHHHHRHQQGQQHQQLCSLDGGVDRQLQSALVQDQLRLAEPSVITSLHHQERGALHQQQRGPQQEAGQQLEQGAVLQRDPSGWLQTVEALQGQLASAVLSRQQLAAQHQQLVEQYGAMVQQQQQSKEMEQQQQEVIRKEEAASSQAAAANSLEQHSEVLQATSTELQGQCLQQLSLERHSWQREAEDLEQQQQQQQLDKTGSRYSDLQHQHQQMLEERASSEASVGSGQPADGQQVQALQALCSGSQEQCEPVCSEKGVLQEAHGQLCMQPEEVGRGRQQLLERQEQLMQGKAAADEVISTLRCSLSGLEPAHQHIEKQQQQVQQAHQQLQQQYGQLLQAHEQLQQQLMESLAEAEQLRQRHEQLRQQHEQLRQQREQLSQQLLCEKETFDKSPDVLSQQLFHAEQENQSLRQQLAVVQSECDALLQSRSSLQAQQQEQEQQQQQDHLQDKYHHHHQHQHQPTPEAGITLSPTSSDHLAPSTTSYPPDAPAPQFTLSSAAPEDDNSSCKALPLMTEAAACGQSPSFVVDSCATRTYSASSAMDANSHTSETREESWGTAHSSIRSEGLLYPGKDAEYRQLWQLYQDTLQELNRLRQHQASSAEHQASSGDSNSHHQSSSTVPTHHPPLPPTRPAVALPAQQDGSLVSSSLPPLPLRRSAQRRCSRDSHLTLTPVDSPRAFYAVRSTCSSFTGAAWADEYAGKASKSINLHDNPLAEQEMSSNMATAAAVGALLALVALRQASSVASSGGQAKDDGEDDDSCIEAQPGKVPVPEPSQSDQGSKEHPASKPLQCLDERQRPDERLSVTPRQSRSWDGSGCGLQTGEKPLQGSESYSGLSGRLTLSLDGAGARVESDPGPARSVPRLALPGSSPRRGISFHTNPLAEDPYCSGMSGQASHSPRCDSPELQGQLSKVSPMRQSINYHANPLAEDQEGDDVSHLQFESSRCDSPQFLSQVFKVPHMRLGIKCQSNPLAEGQGCGDVSHRPVPSPRCDSPQMAGQVFKVSPMRQSINYHANPLAEDL